MRDAMDSALGRRRLILLQAVLDSVCNELRRPKLLCPVEPAALPLHQLLRVASLHPGGCWREFRSSNLACWARSYRSSIGRTGGLAAKEDAAVSMVTKHVELDVHRAADLLDVKRKISSKQ